jgi:hypothetical protein
MTDLIRDDDLVKRLDIMDNEGGLGHDNHKVIRAAARRIEALRAEVARFKALYLAAFDELERRIRDDREACAVVAERCHGDFWRDTPGRTESLTRQGIAAAIRSRRNDPVAQLVEPPAHNGLVVGSSPAGITNSSDVEVIASEARFLIDRLRELDWSDLDVTFRDFCGHVEPSISRLKGALDRRSTREQVSDSSTARNTVAAPISQEQGSIAATRLSEAEEWGSIVDDICGLFDSQLWDDPHVRSMRNAGLDIPDDCEHCVTITEKIWRRVDKAATLRAQHTQSPASVLNTPSTDGCRHPEGRGHDAGDASQGEGVKPAGDA